MTDKGASCSSIWVLVLGNVDDIPGLLKIYDTEASSHTNSAVLVGPSVTFKECAQLENKFDFVVKWNTNETPDKSSFRLWDNVTLIKFDMGQSDAAEGNRTISEANNEVNHRGNEPVAIVGIACRLPGANDYNAFWDNLVNGIDSIGPIPMGRFSPEQVYGKLTRGQESTQAGFLSCSVNTFDANFWGISPMEMDYTDPQARILLQLSWEALENAGIPPRSIHGSDSAIYLGFWRQDYNDLLLQTGSSAGNELRRYLGCSMGNAAARIAHGLGTTGPALSTETGCSASICSIGAAMAALRSGKTGMALAGGANLILKPFTYTEFQGVLSPSGRCKVFQHDADGFARAEGAIMYVLKRASDAISSGDHIYCLLTGYGTSQEGLSRSTGTPTIEGEALAMTLALKDASVSAGEVDWIEMHGTGTKVGDPIEVASTRLAYGLNDHKLKRKKPLIITSVKANIGHTESVSGAAGLLKCIMAMKNGAIPPQRMLAELNPKLNFDGMHIPSEVLAWQGLRAGVSSFGITGSNAHLIVERVPGLPLVRNVHDLPAYILPLSAKSKESMTALMELHIKALQHLDDSLLADYCYTIAVCRDHFKEYRSAFVGTSCQDLIDVISSKQAEKQIPTEQGSPPICFLFPGQGCQFIGMGRGLYENCTVFRRHLDILDALLNTKYGIQLKTLIFEGAGISMYSQLCIFAVEYCILKVWASWGLTPSLVLGHSFGEFASGIAAGNLSLPTAIELLVVSRSKMLAKVKSGSMLVLKADEHVTSQLIKEFHMGEDNADEENWIDISALNANDQTVVSGKPESISQFSKYCSNVHGIKNTELSVPHAFHSRSMEPILSQFESEAENLKYPARFANIGYVSSVFGRVLKSDEIIGANYWRRHMRQRVEFIAAASSALEAGRRTVFLEVGPHPILCPLVSKVNSSNQEFNTDRHLYLPSMRKGSDEIFTILNTCANLYTNGVDVDWSSLWNSFTAGPFNRIPSMVPVYPFASDDVFWFSPPDGGMQASMFAKNEVHPLLGSLLPSMVESAHTFINSSQRLLSNPVTGEWLTDHKLGPHIIFPAAGLVEMVFAALVVVKGGDANLKSTQFGVELDGFEIMSVFPLNQNLEMYTLVQPGNLDETYQVSFHSRRPNSAANVPSKLHAKTNARIVTDRDTTPSGSLVCKRMDNDNDNRALCENIYRDMKTIGYNFGPKFKILENIRTEDMNGHQGITCDLNVDNSLLNSDSFLIHPTIIDAIIQSSLMMTEPDLNALKLPIGIESIRLFALPKNTMASSLRIVGSIKTIGLIGNCNRSNEHYHGTNVATISGLITVTTNIKQFEKSFSQTSTPLPVYIEEWHTSDVSNGVNDGGVTLPLPFEISLEEHAEILQIGNFVLNRVASVFVELGWNWPIGYRLSINELSGKMQIAKSNTKFVLQLLHYLKSAGFLKSVGSLFEWEVLRDLQDINENEAMFGNNYTGMGQQDTKNLQNLSEEWKFALFYCSKLKSLLQGHESVLPYLFPASPSPKSDYSADKLYSTFKTNIGLLKNLTSMFSYLLKTNYKHDRRLKILEVGAGTGNASIKLLPLLQGYSATYTFTDISPSFLSAAEFNLPHVDGVAVKFNTFDLESDVLSQGFVEGDYDIIIALNVLHVTTDVEKVCTNLRKLLRSGGHLLVAEQFQPFAMIDIVFGHCNEYWRFNDPHRKNHCILDLNGWEKVMLASGFQSMFSLDSNTIMGVIVATNESPKESSLLSSNYVIIAEKDSLIAAGLVTALPNDGGARVELNYDSYDDILRLAELIIFCIPKHQHSHLNHNEKQMGLLQNFLRLAQYLVTKKTNSKLLIISHGEAHVSDEEATIPLASSILGLGRTLATEVPTVQINFLDLEHSQTLEVCISQILSELRKPNKRFVEESIISYRGGERHLARLVRLPKSKMTLIPDSRRLQLKLPESLSINDLSYEGSELTMQTLGPNEILVRILASGLNFKDILNIMKPTAEFKNSNAVGADFSGEILSIGTDVEGWRIGDCVIGMNPASTPLPNHVNLDSGLVARLPQRLTHSEGATLPTAFITAYHCLVSVGKLQPGESALIHTASGGVGLAAIQIAKAIGAKLFVTAGSNRKRAYLRSLGLTYVYSSRSVLFAENEILKEGVHLVLNSLTSKGFKQASLSVLRQNGRFIEMSKLNIWTVKQVFDQRPDVAYSIEDLSQLDISLAREYMKQLNNWLESGRLMPLRANVFSPEFVISALNLLGTARHIGKVVINWSGHIFNDRSTYLITGGLGGIGLEVTRWMLASGAKHIVLVSRRGNQFAEAAISKLTKAKVDTSCVVIMSVDVSDKMQVANLLSEIAGKMPPLRGVIHAAGVISDGTLLNQSMTKIKAVFKGKVDGAWNLHDATQHLNLEHFILFSSAVSVLGGLGQGNYAAANSALTGLSIYRNRQGLTSTSIAWGQWEGLGLTANIDRSIFGVQPFSVKSGIEALELLLKRNVSENVVPTLFSEDVKTSWFPNYVDLDQVEEISGIEKTCEDPEELANLSQEDHVRLIVSKILRTRGSLQGQVELRNMGMDSLMFIELKNQLNVKFGFNEDIPENSTVDDLVQLMKSGKD